MFELLSRVVKRKAEVLDARSKLWAEYREIVSRRDSPQKGDENRVVELLEQFGLDDRFLVVHATALDLHGRFTEEAGLLGKHEAEMGACRDELDQLSAKIAAMKQKGEAVAKRYDVASANAIRARSAADQARLIARRFPALFLGDVKRPAVTWGETGVGELTEAIREAGLEGELMRSRTEADTQTENEIAALG